MHTHITAVAPDTVPPLSHQSKLPARRVVVYAVCSLLSIGWAVFAGKDVPWDALHYHLYAGFSAVNDRFALDFFPAGPQTYLNPYPHLPLYWMVRANWSSLAIGMALACLHSVMLWMTYELACAVSRDAGGSAPIAVTLAAVAFTLFNPVLLQEIGSTFTDITTGALALAGYVALANAFAGNSFRLVAFGGALLGAAAALKLSNAFLALIPALPLVLGCVTTTQRRLRALLIFGLCAAAAAIAVEGPWAWRLEKAFGNPFFPMLNDLFRAPGFTSPATGNATTAHASLLETVAQLFNGMRDPRFLPSSFTEALERPFDMLRPRRLIHTEPMAADARYALLLPLFFIASLARVRRRWYGTSLIMNPSRRAFSSLATSFAIGWAIWLTISGNSRYFLPLACVASVLLVAGLYREFAASPRVWIYSLTLVFGLQSVLLWNAADFRWNAQAWGGPWVQATLPLRLHSEPYLYLPMDSQSQSFLLPSLAPGSSLMGINSGLSPKGPGGQLARARLDANVERLRMFKLVEAIGSDGRPIAPAASTFDDPLRQFGLRVDTTDCDYISYKGNASVVERAGPRSGLRDQVYVYTCRVRQVKDVPVQVERGGERESNLVLDRVEDACAELFQPRRGSSLRSGHIWRRNYADVVVWVNDDGFVRFTDLMRGGGDIVGLGRAVDWVNSSPPQLSCWREGGRAHVELKQR